jgi:hypothetical protein
MRAFGTLKLMPKLEEEPEEWFHALDVEGKGSLPKGAVLRALKVLLPLLLLLLPPPPLLPSSFRPPS